MVIRNQKGCCYAMVSTRYKYRRKFKNSKRTIWLLAIRISDEITSNGQQYVKIETGTRNIRISDFLALKQIYGVDFSEFFIGLLPDSDK